MTTPEGGLLIKFYLGERVHPNGRTFDEVIATMDAPHRSTGGVIQWLFPLTTPSRHVPSAPVLSKRELELFRTVPQLRERFLQAANKFLEVYGIAVDGGSVSIDPGFVQKKKWAYATGHSWMPVTRILKSLKLLEFSTEFSTLRKALLLCNQRAGGKVDKSTLDVWMRI